MTTIEQNLDLVRPALGSSIGNVAHIEVALRALDAAGITGSDALIFAIRGLLPGIKLQISAARTLLSYADVTQAREVEAIERDERMRYALQRLLADLEREREPSLLDLSAELSAMRGAA